MKNIDQIRLARGLHKNPDEGICIMEACAWLADETFSDRPECVSPVIGVFMRRLNDSMNDEQRQLLKPYILKIMDTNKPELYVKQAIMFAESATSYVQAAVEYMGIAAADYINSFAANAAKRADVYAKSSTDYDEHYDTYAGLAADYAAKSAAYATGSFTHVRGGEYSSELLALIFETLDKVLELT